MKQGSPIKLGKKFAIIHLVIWFAFLAYWLFQVYSWRHTPQPTYDYYFNNSDLIFIPLSVLDFLGGFVATFFTYIFSIPSGVIFDIIELLIFGSLQWFLIGAGLGWIYKKIKSDTK